MTMLDSTEKPASGSRQETLAGYRDAVIAPERALLHREIVDRMLAGADSSDQPAIVLTGASGQEPSDLEFSRFIDTRGIERHIPEYAELLRDLHERTAEVVGDEAAILREQLIWRAIAERKNLLLDGPTGGLGQFNGVIARARAEYPEYSVAMMDGGRLIPLNAEAAADGGAAAREFREAAYRRAEPLMASARWFGVPAEVPAPWQLIASALYYINHWISAPYFLEIMLGQRTFETSGYTRAYDAVKLKRRPSRFHQDDPAWQEMRRSAEKISVVQPAFANFVSAYSFLLENPGEPSLERFFEIHRRVAPGVEDLKPEHLGQPRHLGITVDYTEESPFHPEEMKVLHSNPYLLFRETRRADGRVYGMLTYADPRYVSPVAVQRIEGVDSALARRIREYQVSRDPRGGWEPAPELLMGRTVEALVRERIEWWKEERAKLGERITPETLDAFLRLVAELHISLISIHLFEEVNGRSTRLFSLYDLLAREGIPPPRLHNSSDDFNLTVEGFAHALREGIERTQRLSRDLEEAALAGRPLEGVARIFFPSLPEGIDASDFLEWVKARLASDEAMRALYLREPHQACDRLVSFYREGRSRMGGGSGGGAPGGGVSIGGIEVAADDGAPASMVGEGVLHLEQGAGVSSSGTPATLGIVGATSVFGGLNSLFAAPTLAPLAV